MTESGPGTASVLRRSVPAGVAGGLVAPVVSTGLTAALLALDDAFLDDLTAWTAVVRFLYGTHHVPVSISTPTGRRSVDVAALAAGSLTIPLLLYLFVPILVLLLVGFVVARRRLDPGATATEGTIAGATVVVGYLPLAVVGALLLTTTVGADAAGPDLLASFVVAGLVYPVTFGGIGGTLATLSN